MPITMHPDGKVTADTAAELAEYARALRDDHGTSGDTIPDPSRRRAHAKPQRSAKKSAKTPKNGGRSKTVKDTRRWTPSLFREFCDSIAKGVRDTISAGLKAGVGADSEAIAKITESPMQGIGKRIAKVVSDAEKFSNSLPAPMQFVGDPGRRSLAINSSFAASAGGGTT